MSHAISHEDAVAIDTKLAELWGQRAQSTSYLQSSKLSLASHLGIRSHYVTRTRREVVETLETLVEMATTKIADEATTPWKRDEIQRTLDKISQYKQQIEDARATAAPLEETYSQSPWQRFFLVTNQKGHIHASMSCHSCNMRTQFAWLPELSGLTEKDAVDAHGPLLCSHCFPTAPVEWTIGEQPKVDPNQCPGSGTYDIEEGTHRRTGYSGTGRGTCLHCEQTVSTTSTGKIRKHKKNLTQQSV